MPPPLPLKGCYAWLAELKFVMFALGWKEELVCGTKVAYGTKPAFLGTKSADEALKGFADGVATLVGLAVALSRGLVGSLQVETSVEPAVDGGEFRSEFYDWAAN